MPRSRPRTMAAAGVLLSVASLATPTARARGVDVAVARAAARRQEIAAARSAARDLVAALSESGRGSARRLKRLDVAPGDLLSASERQYAALRVTLDEPPAASRARLKEKFLPRGVDYHAERGLLAIAAVSQVILYDLHAGALEVLASPSPEVERFDLANDVLFDAAGGLLIADMGALSDDAAPPDGAVWRLDIDSGEVTEVGTKYEFSNPALLSLDPSGSVHVVDRSAGAQIVSFLPDRWDTVHRLSGKKLLRVASVWSGSGLQATAYDIDAAGRHWFANVTDVAILDTGVLSSPCGVTTPFRFATGLVTGDDGAWVLDGADVRTTERRLFRIESDCTATLLSEANKLRKSRGLARVPATSDSDP